MNKYLFAFQTLKHGAGVVEVFSISADTAESAARRKVFRENGLPSWERVTLNRTERVAV